MKLPKTSRPSNIGMIFFVVGSALINIPHVLIDNTLLILIFSSIAEVIIFIGMVLSKFEKEPIVNNDIENPLNNNTISNNEELIDIPSVVEIGPTTYYTEECIINIPDIKPSTTPNGPFESYLGNSLPPTIPSINQNQ